MDRILIVDDEFLIRYTLEEGLKDRGYDAYSVATVEEGLEFVRKYHPGVLLLDNLLENSVGMDEIVNFKNADEELQVIMMTAYGSVSQAVEATKRGAYDYILKPFDVDEIDMLIKRCLEQKRNRDSLVFLKGDVPQFLGVSEAAARIRHLIQVLGENLSVNVLLRGETGTGKEVVARQIHANSARKDNLMVRINCGAIPENLMESELFGYERGAFAGALKTKKGLIELADGGTVFLDEIGELPMAMQTKLLTFLDDRKFKRIGALEDTAVDVRIIAATNRNLEEAIKAGQFREDLFYRLNVMQIEIPPLRDRREDIPVLCDYYLDYYNKAFARNIEKVDPDFMRELLLYDWKGNVRELKNIFERCFLFSQGNILEKHVELAPVEREARPESGDCIYLKDLKKGPIDLEQEVAAIETALVTVSRTNLNRSFVQDVPYTLVDADGNAQYAMINDGRREYLEYLNKLYVDGIIDRDFVNRTEADTKKLMYNGTVACMAVGNWETREIIQLGQTVDPSFMIQGFAASQKRGRSLHHRLSPRAGHRLQRRLPDFHDLQVSRAGREVDRFPVFRSGSGADELRPAGVRRTHHLDQG